MSTIKYLMCFLFSSIIIFNCACSNENIYQESEYVGEWKANSSLITDENQELLKNNYLIISDNGKVIHKLNNKIINGVITNGNNNDYLTEQNIIITYENGEKEEYVYDSINNTMSLYLNNGNIIIFETN